MDPQRLIKSAPLTKPSRGRALMKDAFKINTRPSQPVLITSSSGIFTFDIWHLACPTFRVPHPTIHDRRVKMLIDRGRRWRRRRFRLRGGGVCVIENEEEEEEETIRGEISQIYDSGIFLSIFIADSAGRKSIFQRRRGKRHDEV